MVPSDKIESRRKRWRKYYYKYPEKMKERRIRSQKANQEFVDQFKTKCCKCGITDKRVLDFHHVDETAKVRGVATLRIAGYSKKKIKDEIEKCIVVCANCHRVLHWKMQHPEEVQCDI